MSLKGGSRKLTQDPPAAPPAQPEVLMVDAQLPQVPPFVLARVAGECAAAAQRALALLARPPTALQLLDARSELTEIAALGLLAQRAARVLGGDYLPQRESVALDAAVQSAVALARQRATRRGAVVTTQLHAVALWMDPAVLDLLLELALHWALGLGRHVQLRVAIAPGSLHPDLVVAARELQRPLTGEQGLSDDEFNDPDWLLLRLVAHSQLLDPQRVLTDDGAMLILRFPPPVQAVEADAGVVVSESPRPTLEAGASAGGCHVLVVEADPGLRLQVRQLLHDAGMRVEAFASAREAEDLSRHFVAEAVVNGGPPDHPDLLALLAVLRQKNPSVRVIQLTDEDTLYIGTDDQAEAARVGRSSISQALVQAVLLSVGVFAPPTLAATAHRRVGD